MNIAARSAWSWPQHPARLNSSLMNKYWIPPIASNKSKNDLSDNCDRERKSRVSRLSIYKDRGRFKIIAVQWESTKQVRTEKRTNACFNKLTLVSFTILFDYNFRGLALWTFFSWLRYLNVNISKKARKL